MLLDHVLFGMRLVSGLVLITFLGVLFVVLWRDYHITAIRTEITRRTYGQLITMIELNGALTPTGLVHAVKPLTSIGRAPTNAIVINDSFASNEHATVSLKDGRWWLEDRNSRNGTLLNGELITTPIIITDGDVFSIGSTYYKFSLDQ